MTHSKLIMPAPPVSARPAGAPVGGLDDVEIVLDDGVAVIAQPVQYHQQLCDVVEGGLFSLTAIRLF